MQNKVADIFSIKFVYKAFFLFSILIPTFVFSAPPFAPGETLNPGCLPANLLCTVVSTTTVTHIYASSTFPSFDYGSSTYYLASNPAGYLTLSTDPWMMASSSYLTTASSTATYLTILNAAATYLTLSASTSLAYIPSASSSIFLSTTSALSTYLKLDASNGPLTNSLSISTSSPELRLMDGESSRIMRTSTNNVLTILNVVNVPAMSQATGGDITYTDLDGLNPSVSPITGGYTVHTFTTTGQTFVPPSSIDVDYLVVAGGGGGGQNGAGAGGAGGMRAGSTTISTSQTITIGAGGAGGTVATPLGANGGNSSIGSLVVSIGGGGGNQWMTNPGSSGGSGGGGGGNTGIAGAGTVGQGNAGGNGTGNGGGGGGGAGAVGSSGVTGNGGNGLQSSITGTLTYYAGGGGGGTFGISTGGLGGGGAGGRFAPNTSSGTNGTDGLGGGGGGDGHGNFGGSGGSGIVIVRYLTPVNSPSEATLVKSEDSLLSSTYGINTFGDYRGETHLSGKVLYFDINGVNKAVLDVNGNLGIGTSTPQTALHVVGTTTLTQLRLSTLTNTILSVNANGDVVATSSSAVLAHLVPYTGATQSVNLGNNALTVNGTSTFATSTFNGNVGIGTSTPLSKLHVVVTSNNESPTLGTASGGLYVSSVSGLYGLLSGVGNSGSSWLQAMRTDGTATAYNLVLNPAGGKVGIGSADASYGLNVQTGVTNERIKVQGTGSSGFYLTHPSGTDGATVRADGTAFQIYRNNSETTPFTILNSNGNIGIGTTTPETMLVVTGTSTLQDILPGGPYTGNMSAYSLGASTTRWLSVWAETINIGTSTWSLQQTGDRFGIFNSANGSGTEALTILNNGNIGIGTTTPGNKFTLEGDASFIGTTTFGTINSTGEIKITDGNYSRLIRTSTEDDLSLYNNISTLAGTDGTGGNITHDSPYTIHTFSATGTATFTPPGTQTVEVLVVAGGGGGGVLGGGGGGGGVVYHSGKTVSGAISVTVGDGGIAAPDQFTVGGSGSNSVFGDITALGGGGGISQSSISGNGGSGGGGGSATNLTGGTATQGNSGGGIGYGNNGGNGSGSSLGGGGGGGAGAVGTNASGATAGNGGVGTTSSITGSSVTYAGGGGGGAQSGTGGTGGTGGGGSGTGNSSSATAGTANTGGGGGSAGYAGSYGTSANGGSGIVIIKYIPVGSVQEVKIVNSKNSLVVGEYGVNIFGADLGATHLNGGSLSFDINGITKAKLDSTGNFVIGTSTATSTALLDIYGVSTTSDIFAISSSSNARYLTVTSAGFVGIGTTTPETMFVVNGTSTLQNILPGGPYTGNMSAYSLGASTTRWLSVWAETVNIGTSTWSLKQTGDRFGIFNSANGGGTESFTILSNGNVGIGTTTPNKALSVVGDVAFSGNIDTSNTTFGNINSTGEFKITNGTDARIVKTSINDRVTIYNTVQIQGAAGTGGDITNDGAYTIHTFTATSTPGTFTPVGTVYAEVLVVAGGGGGSGGGPGAGGGGGGVVASSSVIISGPQTITVGVGGVAGAGGGGNGGQGGNSSIGSIITATGGGFAGGGANASGGNGGSGGGARGLGIGGTGSQGYNGGTGFGSSEGWGGGGGAGANGGTAISLNLGGSGGNGTSSLISGISVIYGGGGGGGGYDPNGWAAGSGGTGGGGNGSSAPSTPGYAGTDGLGGGGGGDAGGPWVGAGRGGSGVVIIRYIASTASQEISLVESKDSAVDGEYGINTFGATLGATHLNGNALYFDINGITKAKLDSTGNFVIGTSTATSSALLDIYGVSTTSDIFAISSSSGSRYMTVTSAGKVGIGTSSPSATLTIEGTPTTTLLRLVNIGAGSLDSDASGNVINTSDERLKDIQGVYEKGLAEIKQLTPINYKWKTETGYDASTTYSGFSAQNVHDVIPEATGKNGAGFLTLNDRPIIAALVNAVKQIASFITKIESGIAYLKDIVIEKLTLGSAEAPAGVTMYSKNGNAFCMTVSDSGSFESTAGVCQSSTSTPIINTATVFTPPTDTGSTTSTSTDTLAPIINILGLNPEELIVNQTYTDAGATATDDTDLLVTVSATGTVDTSTVGTYSISYTAVDLAGNIANAIRTINILEEPATSTPIVIDIATSTP